MQSTTRTRLWRGTGSSDQAANASVPPRTGSRTSPGPLAGIETVTRPTFPRRVSSAPPGTSHAAFRKLNSALLTSVTLRRQERSSADGRRDPVLATPERTPRWAADGAKIGSFQAPTWVLLPQTGHIAVPARRDPATGRAPASAVHRLRQCTGFGSAPASAVHRLRQCTGFGSAPGWGIDAGWTTPPRDVPGAGRQHAS